VEKAPDADILREMIAFAVERLMEVEVGARTGAAHREGSSDRLARRRLLFSELSRAAADQPGPCRYLRAMWGWQWWQLFL
jgi:hypothetical protein